MDPLATSGDGDVTAGIATSGETITAGDIAISSDASSRRTVPPFLARVAVTTRQM